MIKGFSPVGTCHLDHPLRILLFDSWFDQYRGVICHIAVIDGTLKRGRSTTCVVQYTCTLLAFLMYSSGQNKHHSSSVPSVQVMLYAHFALVSVTKSVIWVSCR